MHLELARTSMGRAPEILCGSCRKDLLSFVRRAQAHLGEESISEVARLLAVEWLTGTLARRTGDG